MRSANVGYIELVLLFVAFLWGINPPIMKVGLLYIPPLAYNMLRMLIALVIVWIALGLSKEYRSLAREDIKQICLLSIVGFFVFQLFFTVGVQKTTAGNASLILNLLPVSVAIINKLLKIENISLPVAVGIFVSLVGVVLIVIGSGKAMSIEHNHLTGIFLLLLAQCGYGYYTVFSKKLVQRYSSYQITAYVITITTVLFFSISLPSMTAIQWSEIPLVGWLSVLYSGVFGVCVGNFLWMWAIGKIGSTKTALYGNLSPVFAVTTGYLFLDEAFGMLQFSGAVVIFVGLYITRIKGDFYKYFVKDKEN
jgi:drug/metabolite transporter (DMT)-like permease